MTKPELIRTWMFALYNTGIYAEYEVSEENIINFLGHPDIAPFVNCKENNLYTLLFTHEGTFEDFAEQYNLVVKDVIGMYRYILRVFDNLLPQNPEAIRRRLTNAYAAFYGLSLNYTRDKELLFEEQPAINDTMVEVAYARTVLGKSVYEIECEFDIDRKAIVNMLSIIHTKLWIIHCESLTSYNKPLHMKCIEEGLPYLGDLPKRASSLWTAAEYIRKPGVFII